MTGDGGRVRPPRFRDAVAAAGLADFVESGLVTRDALLGRVPCPLAASVDMTEFAPLVDIDGSTSVVAAWRAMYEYWCIVTGHRMATPAAFSRRMREVFGVRTVPGSRRLLGGGRCSQCRVFIVDDTRGGIGGGATGEGTVCDTTDAMGVDAGDGAGNADGIVGCDDAAS